MSGLIELGQCPACGGPLAYLGRLGSLDWSRCRNCGADWSEPAQVADEPADE